MRIMTTILTTLAAAFLISSCSDDIPMRRPPKPELPDLPAIENIHTFKAPLYWSVYEYCYELERNGVEQSKMDISEAEWDKIIEWVATDLKPYGYDMICTDGFIPMLAKDASGYMTHYGSMPIKTLVEKAKRHGLKVGIYDNPLWIHGPDETKIAGTDYTFGSLKYSGSDPVAHPGATSIFSWVVATHPGAQEYIDGFFKHFHDMGIDYIRMDFMSWYEDGKDRNLGISGHGYGRDVYARALNYIAQSAKKYGVFTSVVMPHLYDDAVLEAEYGNMIRIVADTGTGGWRHCSAQDKGKSYSTWPNCMNMFDGFTYWSHVSGRNKVILDGDFIRLNTFDNDDEKKTVISLQIMAGGPVTVADQYHTIGDNLKFYTNTELLELNSDRFVGKPLSDKLGDRNNEIWYGQTSDGDYVVGLFNRDNSPYTYSLKLQDYGISGEWKMRDLWTHTDEGTVTAINTTVPAHGCKIVRLSK